VGPGGVSHMSMLLRRPLLGLSPRTAGRQMLAPLDELRRTACLRRDELLALQQTKRQQLIQYAYQYVPYYRRTFDALGFHPEDLRREPSAFQRLPVVTKDDMRRHYSEFITTHPTVRKTLTP